MKNRYGSDPPTDITNREIWLGLFWAIMILTGMSRVYFSFKDQYDKQRDLSRS